MDAPAPAPFRIAFDNARDPYTARNALGITSIGGGGGAPVDAEYIVAVSDPTLTNERVLTNTASVTWDFSTPGQAKATTAAGGGNVSNSGTPTVNQYARWVTATTIQGVSAATVLSDIGAQPLDATLTALAAYNTNGLLTQTAADTFTGRSIAVPAAGISITNANGVAGNPTLALADDLAALEALTGTNTIYYRSGTSTWTAVTVSTGLSFTGGTLTCTVTTGGNVSNVGTPANGQYARWTGATTIEGRTATQVTADLDVFTGDAGAGGLKGLVKAPAAGDAAKYLRGDATWAAGTTAATQGNLVLITSTTVGSAVASVNFTTGIGSTYDEYEIHVFNVRPATSLTQLMIRISLDGGSTYKAGGTDYYYSFGTGGTSPAGSNAGASGIIMHTADMANAVGLTGNFRIRFASPSSTAIYKLFDWVGSYWTTTTTPNVYGAGSYQIATTAINAIRFLYSSGNIAQGTFILYGVVK